MSLQNRRDRLLKSTSCEVLVSGTRGASDRYRRIFLVAASSGEGLLTERKTVAHLWRRELAFMAHSGRSPTPPGTAQEGGKRSFAGTGLDDKVARKRPFAGTKIERQGSTHNGRRAHASLGPAWTDLQQPAMNSSGAKNASCDSWVGQPPFSFSWPRCGRGRPCRRCD